MEYLANKTLTRLEKGSSLDQNLTILKKKLVELNGLKEYNESIKSEKEVGIWFRNVERINGEILNLENEVRGNNVLPHVFLGETVLEKIQEVEELLRKGKNFDGLVIDEPQCIGHVLSTTNVIGDVAKEVTNEIWAYLMEDGVSKIGVWGMGGVGKTTVMKLINNQLLKETEKFNKVIWITVSQELNISKLQDRIADALNVDRPEAEDEAIRAGLIYEMLSRTGKYVLILDDLWDLLSLEEVGIPEPSNGSKLVVTTRLLDVCRCLGCLEVRMPLLSKLDALTLFLKNVNEDVLNHPQPLPIVERVVENCGGLPLAIVTIAQSMSGVRDVDEWRNALHELRRHETSVGWMAGTVFQQLQFSYDRLHNEKLKHCFLCCALYPEDHEINIFKLIDLWVAAGLVEEGVGEGLTILNKLKNSGLIESGTRYPQRTVKLHNMVRDMALCIASPRPPFLVRAELQLKATPNVQKWNGDLEKVKKEWMLLLVSAVLEVLLVALEQCASPKKPYYSLIAVVVSIMAMFICSIELFDRGRSDSRREKPFYLFYSVVDMFSLISAFSQCIFSVVAYCYHHRGRENPIKVSIVSVIFIICMALSKYTSKQNVVSPPL